MADDGSGGHFSPLKVVVAGSVTRNAIENSNALLVTEPATCFFFLKNVVFFGYFGFSIFFPCFRVMARTRGVEKDRQPL